MDAATPPTGPSGRADRPPAVRSPAMRTHARPRRRPRTLGAAGLGVLGLLLVSPPPAEAANRTVEVARTESGSFTPAEVSIEVGDTVTWEWTENEHHHVRFPDHPDLGPTDDSGGAECVPGAGVFRPSCEGHTFQVRFAEAGEYRVVDEGVGAESEGLVVVTETATEPDTAPPKPTPTSEPTTDPGPSEPTTDPEPDPSPTGTEPAAEPEPEPEPEPPPPPPPSPPPSAGTADPPRVTTDASPTETMTADEPAVAGAASPSPVPEPSFEEFPEAADPTPAEDVDGEVALDLPDDDGGDAARTVWGVVGGVTLLGTLGAFGHRVLFAEPWD